MPKNPVRTGNGLVLYHNSACSKSRAVFEILKSRGIDFEVVEYLKTPPGAETLDHLLTLLGKEPQEIIRDHEDEFEPLRTNPPRTRAEWIQAMVANPILIERPILTDGTRAVIGRPPERVLELLDK